MAREVASPAGRVTAGRHAVACVLGCGRQGIAPHFVRDLRMPGVLVRAEAGDLEWFVCGPCQERVGRPLACLRCGFETHVPVAGGLRCARCGEAGADPD